MNIATGVFVIAVIATGYFVFFKKETAPIAPTTGASTALGVAQTIAVSTDIARTKTELSELKKTVTDSIEVFSSREFRSLQDFTVGVPEEPIGRPNPFVPTDWKIKIKAAEAAASKKSGSTGGSSAPAPVETSVKPTVDSSIVSGGI